MKEKMLKVSTYVLLAMALLVTIVGTKIMSSISFGVGTAEVLLEASLEKYINYNLSEEEKGTLVEYRIKANLQQEENASIENSEIKMKLNQIDGKYPESVAVVRKGMNLEGKYEYHSETGEVVVKDSIGQDNSEYAIIGYYNTYVEENKERDIVANVTATATLAGEEKLTVTANQEVENKVLENVGQLTSINHAVEDLYNGYIKSNQINGTNYNTEYHETEEIMISKKQAQETIEMTENNTFENGQIGAVYKSTKINKDTLVEVLGEEGKVEILDAEGNVMATLDKDNQEANYENELESISIRTTGIQKEGILELEHNKEIKSTMATVENKQLKTTTTMAGAETLENIVEMKDAQTNVEISVNNAEWTNKQQNEITFDVSLKANGKEDNLFKNPSVRIELPNEVEKVIIQNSGIFYPNGLELQAPYIEENANGNKVIVANLTGNQTQYTENEIDLTTDVKITATIILKKDMQEADSNVKLTYTNQYGSTRSGEKELGLKLETYQEDAKPQQEETQTYQLATASATAVPNVEGLKLEVAPVKGDVAVNNEETLYEGEYIKYNVKVSNTSDHTMNDVKVVGTIPEGVTFGELEADYYNAYGKYEYKLDETIKEKEIQIGTIEPGQTVSAFYEVKVNDLAENETEKEIVTAIKAKVGEVEATTFEMKNTIQKAEVKVFLGAYLDAVEDKWNYPIVLTSEESKEVTVKVKLPKEYEVDYVFDWSVLGTENKENNEVPYTLENNILTTKLKTNQKYHISGSMKREKLEQETEESKIELMAVASVEENGKTYYSNENRIMFEYESAAITMTSENEGEEVKAGDEIKYQITVTNTGRTNLNDKLSTDDSDEDIIPPTINVNVADFLPKDVEPISISYQDWEEVDGKYITSEEMDDKYKVHVDGEIVENQKEYISAEQDSYYVPATEFKKGETKTEDIEGISKKDEEGNPLPELDLDLKIPYKESVTIEVTTRAGEVSEKTKVENRATVTGDRISTKVSNIVTHTILPDEEIEEPDDPEEPNDPTNPDDPNDPTNPENPTDKYSIAGLAWLDENEDGQRQAQEKLLSGITAMVVDMKDAKNVKAKGTTDSNGAYRFQDLEKGNYVVLFQYDTNQYRVAEYQKTGVNSQFNSDAVVKEVTLNGENIKAGMIEVSNLEASVSNMDIGLIQNKKCDFKVDKSISKVTVTTNQGTKQYTYNNEKLAKIEIRAKEIEGATVVIEYKIVVTNEGEMPATVGKIVDELPEGLTFSSELNKQWSTGAKGQLVNTSISSKKLEVGESVELTLVATKKMTASGTGTFTNTARVTDITNPLGIEDRNADNDTSKADVIISVSTGAIVYLSIGIVLVAIIGAGVFVAYKRGILKTKKIALFLLAFIALAAIVGNNIVMATEVWYNQTAYFVFNDISTGHRFAGGPTGIGWCEADGKPNWDGGYSYSWHNNITRTTTVTKTADTSFTLTKLNDEIEVKTSGNNFIFGPFKVQNSDSNLGYTLEITDYKNGKVNGTICDRNGDAKSIKGTCTFYVRIPISRCDNGIKKIKLSATKHGIQTKTTDEYGTIHYYPWGGSSYQIVGTGGPRPWVRRITEDEDISKTHSVSWTVINGALKIVKVDKDTGERMPNVEMQVTASGGYSKTFTTDKNGEIYIDNLPAGKKYKVTELKVPYYGYTATVTVNKTLKKGKQNVFTLKNIKQTGNLQIVKKDPNNNSLILPGVTFKVKDVHRGYLVIQDANKVAQKQVTGTTYLSDFPQYTSDEAQATEFVTDANGLTEIRNLWIGNYEVTETSVGNHEAYEIDPEYISWSVNGKNLGKGQKVTIEVTRQSSKDTKPDSSNPKRTVLTAFDKRKYINLSGYVWEDLACAKDPRFVPLYNSGGEYGDLNDKLLEGIKVELVNTKTGEVKEQYTDKDGKYSFLKIKIDDIPNYYVRFYYNGMCYENIPINTGAHNGSKAGEGTARNDFNKAYSRIEGNTADTGVALDENGNKTYDLTYKTTSNTSEISYRRDKDESQYNFGYEENKNSKCPVNGVDDQYMIIATTQNAYNGGNLDKIKTPDEIREQSIEELENINLGVQKRAKPDITLGKDLHNVKIAINGYGHTYFYSKRFDANPEYTGEGFNVGVKFKNKWTGTYTREIYRSDYDYKPEDTSRELKVYITYELKMLQSNANVKARVNSIVDYYDKNYELVKVGSSINQESGEITNDITTKDQGEFGKYKKVLIENNTELEPKTETSIYVQFAMNKDAIGKVLDKDGENLDNVAEINSYSIFDAKTGAVSAGIDLDSNPGNAVPREQADYEEVGYEDDTSTSPGLQLKTKKARQLTGKVFIDNATGGLELQTGEVRQGDGAYNNGETGIQGVKITFKDERSGNTYTDTTDANGDFKITEYIPGDYTLTYTWGGQTYTLNGQQETITVQDYKGTIYNEPDRQKDTEWYKRDLNTDSRRYSDAMDDWETRLKIDEEIATVRNNMATMIDKMNSTTPKMAIRVECQGTGGRQIDGIEYQEGNDENYYKDKYEYIIRNVDFGIIERAKQDLAITKRVKSLKLTLANGQVIADLSVEEDQNGRRKVTGERSGVTYMPPETDRKSNGFVRLELDNELIQGSRLEVTYEFKVANQSELDYKSENFYHFGIVEGNPITIKPTKIMDYLDKDWAFDEDGSAWKVKTLEDVQGLLNENVYQDEKTTIENKKLLYTEELANKELAPGQSESLDLNVSKILTTTDEILFNNETEIVELSREYGSIPESTPGNYVPGKDKFVESDDSIAETVSVTSATGANREFILPIMIGVTACIILGAGVIFIKKKVL